MDVVVDQPMVVSEGVVFAELDGEAVLLNVDTGVYYGLDPLGTQIWHLVDQGLSEAAICERLLDGYDVQPEELRTDVAAFLAEMCRHGLLRTIST
jgi:hypothetical protein